MSVFSVTILGCSSATPTADRHPSAQVVHIGDCKLLIDCGEGTQNQMFRYHIKYNKIDHILISHMHGDHFLGLPGLLSTMSLNGRQKKLKLIGPSSLKNLITDFMTVSETHLQFEIEHISTNPLEAELILETDSFSISSFPLKHRVPCTGFLVREIKDPRKILADKCIELNVPVKYYPILKRGKDYVALDGTVTANELLTTASAKPKSFAYCSDTIYDPGIVSYIKNVDLLYHESTFSLAMAERASETWHSTAGQAAMIATQAQVKQLIIGHFSARYSNLEELLTEARAEFEHSELAIEGRQFSL